MDPPDQSDMSSSSPSPDLIKVKKVKTKSQTKIKVKRHRSLSKTKLATSSSNSSLGSNEEVLKQYYRVKSREPPHKEKIKAKRRKTPGGHSVELIAKKSTPSLPPTDHEQGPTTADVDSVVESKDEHQSPDKSVAVDGKSEDKELDHKNDTQEATVKEVEKSLENPQSAEVTESKASDGNKEDPKATEAMSQDSSKKSSIDHNEIEVEEKMAKPAEEDTKGKAAPDKVDEPQLKEVQAKELCEAKEDELWKTPNSESPSPSPDMESIPKMIPKRKKSITKIKVKRYRSASSLGKGNSSSSGSLSKDQMVQQYFRVKSQDPPHKQKIKAKRRKSVASLMSKGQVDCQAKVSNDHENDQKEGTDESVAKNAHKGPDKPLTSDVVNQSIEPESQSKDQENKVKSPKLLEHQVVLDHKEDTEEMDHTKVVTASEMAEPLDKEEAEANSKPIVNISEAGPTKPSETKEDKPLELEQPVGDDHKNETGSSANVQNLADSDKDKLESQPREVNEEVPSKPIVEDISSPLEKVVETRDQVTDDYKDKHSSQTEAHPMQDIAKANGQDDLMDAAAGNKEKVAKLDENDPKMDHTKPEPKVASIEVEPIGVSPKQTIEDSSTEPQAIVPASESQPPTISIRSGNLQQAQLTIEPTDVNAANTTQPGVFLVGAIILIIAIYLMFMR